MNTYRFFLPIKKVIVFEPGNNYSEDVPNADDEIYIEVNGKTYQQALNTLQKALQNVVEL